MLHVHPIDDSEEHELEGTQCKCNPQVIIESNSDIIVVHNSFDGREAVEWANEILLKPTTMTLEQVAQVAHEINKSYCESLGDMSQVSWEDAPDWQKESAIHGVDFHLNNPDATPEKSHEVWCIEKANAGWKWGPVKDAEKKEHPCFCLYSELPLEQRSKDYLFRQIVHSLKPYIR